MASNIIRKRLAKQLALNGDKSKYAQYRNPTRKRKSGYKKGVRRLSQTRAVMLTVELDNRLTLVCEKFLVQRGAVIRDALEFYLDLAEPEMADAGPLSGLDALPPKLAPGQVRRPDGIIVSMYDTDPTAKRPGD